MSTERVLHTAEETAHHDHVEAFRQRLRLPCALLGVVGGVLGLLASLHALDVVDLGGLFGLIEGRHGTGVGTVALVLSLISLGGAAAIFRSPAGGSALMYIGGCGGYLAIGGYWLWPGILILIGANLALWAISDPLWDDRATVPARGRAKPKGA